MQQITVYQINSLGFFLYQTVANELPFQPGMFNIPYDAIELAPPNVDSGYVARFVNGEWQVVEDHRKDTLFYQVEQATNEKPPLYAPYKIADVVQIDGESMSYDGGGPVPVWLLSELPVQEPMPTEEELLE